MRWRARKKALLSTLSLFLGKASAELKNGHNTRWCQGQDLLLMLEYQLHKWAFLTLECTCMSTDRQWGMQVWKKAEFSSYLPRDSLLSLFPITVFFCAFCCIYSVFFPPSPLFSLIRSQILSEPTITHNTWPAGAHVGATVKFVAKARTRSCA